MIMINVKIKTKIVQLLIKKMDILKFIFHKIQFMNKKWDIVEKNVMLKIEKNLP